MIQEPNDHGQSGDVEILQSLRAEVNQLIARTRPGLTGSVVLGIGFLLWLLSGIYTVGPGERGVVLTFGRLTALTNPGLQYRLPMPFQSHDSVDVAQVRRAEIGFVSTPQGLQAVPREALMLTGDENIVLLELFVQYVIQDPVKYLFKVRGGAATLRSGAEVALRSEVGQHPVESTMTEGRVTVQTAVQARLQRFLDSIDSGIVVTEARLLTVDPPPEVRDAFLEVVRAFEDRDRLVRQADAYRERVLPEARGEAVSMVREAEGYRESRILRAQGDADRFIHTLNEYQQAPAVTRERLYLEMIERTLPNTERIVVDTQGNGVSTLFPLRPLVSAEQADATNLAPGSTAPRPSPTPAPRPSPTPAPRPSPTPAPAPR